ncbi:hypothetical protein OUZ56_007579 [Daphnia magna]|uniref:Uncharacterized protein n=1 Tax=Daphnia magna TaxID=35525 RepID=A0ABR0AAB6_9CRUS|nr:hypothetical protein OUZ56_007579 [Daphnia magna]
MASLAPESGTDTLIFPSHSFGLKITSKPSLMTEDVTKVWLTPVVRNFGNLKSDGIDCFRLIDWIENRRIARSSVLAE